MIHLSHSDCTISNFSGPINLTFLPVHFLRLERSDVVARTGVTVEISESAPSEQVLYKFKVRTVTQARL